MEEGPRAHGAEAGGLRPQAQGRLEPPEAGRAGRPCPGALGQLDFRLCPAGSERRHVCCHELPCLGSLAPATPATRVTRCLLSMEQLISDTSASEMPLALLADGETEARVLRRADLSGWGGIRASPLHLSPKHTAVLRAAGDSWAPGGQRLVPSPKHQDACLDLCLPSLFTAGGLCPGRAGPAGASTTSVGRCSAVSEPRSGQLHTAQPKPSPVCVHMGRLCPGLDTSGVGCGDPVRGTHWEDLRKREPVGVQVGGHRTCSCVWFPRPHRLKKKMHPGRAASRILFGTK